MASKTKKKKAKPTPSKGKAKKDNPVKSVAGGSVQQVDVPKFLKKFDDLLNNKEFTEPQKMLDSLRVEMAEPSSVSNRVWGSGRLIRNLMRQAEESASNLLSTGILLVLVKQGT